MLMNKKLIAILLFLCLTGTASAANHYFTGLPLTASGWTDFETLVGGSGYASARVIFVAADGDNASALDYSVDDLTFDANGIFQAPAGVKAYKTVAAGYARTRTGYPDILLLKRGDTFYENFGTGSIGAWTRSGPSSTVRTILASYGSSGARPTLAYGDTTGFGITTASNIIVNGIRFYHHNFASGGDGRGVDMTISASHHLYEDCMFERMRSLVHGYPHWTGFHYYIAFRRSVFYNGNQGSLGGNLYVYQTHNFLTEECVFDNSLTVSGTNTGNRFFYVNPGDYEASRGLDVLYNVTGFQLRRNIFHQSERTGLSLRAGGVVENNLILKNDTFLMGGHGGSGGSVQTAYVRNNVILEGPLGAGDGHNGLWLKNIGGGEVVGNIWADRTGVRSSAVGLLITGGETGDAQEASIQVFRNVTISGNIIHDRAGEQGLDISSYLTDVSGNIITGNDFQFPTNITRIVSHRINSFSGIAYSNQRYYSTSSESGWFRIGASTNTNLAGWVTASGETGAAAVQAVYPQASRTIRTYNQSLGGTASTAAFVAEAVQQSRHNWRTAYTAWTANDYIRAGFGMSAIPVGYEDDPYTCGNTPSLCLSESECTDAGWNWCDGACQTAACIVPDVCDSLHLNLCLTSGACNGAGGFWYDNTCNATPQPECGPSSLSLCGTEAACLGAGGYWCSGVCQATDCANYGKTKIQKSSHGMKKQQSTTGMKINP
jgi:hypothetical protein